MIHQEQDSKVLFEEFLQEKTFLHNLAPKTLAFYRQSFKAFALTFPVNQNQLNSTVVCLRLLALLTLLTDTGVRINEALTLTRASVDFENLLIDVKGKGSKVRRIPFSLECRKVLFKPLRSHSHELVFCNRDGAKIRYDNLRRDFRKLVTKLGIKGFDGSFHAFRPSVVI